MSPVTQIAGLTSEDLKAAVLTSPAITGAGTAATQTAGNDSARLATTAFVQTALAGAGAVTSGTADPTGGNAGDAYLQVDSSNVLQSIWRNVSGTWTEYNLPAGGGVAGDNTEVLFDNYDDATSALAITPGGASADWTAARSLTIDLGRALTEDDDYGELRIDTYGLTVFEAGSQPVNQTRRAWWNVNAGHFRTAAVNTLTTGDDSVDGWTTAVMRSDNQGDNDLLDNHTRMMILSRGRSRQRQRLVTDNLGRGRCH